jgi:hypothetical protein
MRMEELLKNLNELKKLIEDKANAINEEEFDLIKKVQSHAISSYLKNGIRAAFDDNLRSTEDAIELYRKSTGKELDGDDLSEFISADLTSRFYIVLGLLKLKPIMYSKRERKELKKVITEIIDIL